MDQILTSRLLLRPLQASDVEGIFTLDSDPEVHRYLGGRTIMTLAQAEAIIQKVREQYEAYGVGRLAMIEKASGDFIGWTGLKWETAGIHGREAYYDLGYRLIPKYWGKGYATEGAKASLELGFETMGIDEICAAAHEKNIGSNRILRKLGFEHTSNFEFEGMTYYWYEMNRSRWRQLLIPNS